MTCLIELNIKYEGKVKFHFSSRQLADAEGQVRFHHLTTGKSVFFQRPS
jgi:hypothetical protein